MIRALTAAAVVALLSAPAQGQDTGVLHITITLSDAARGSVPVPRHALLISDNPATSTPRRVLTGADGTTIVRLRPGNYTVESDEPVAFNGKGYQWAQNVDMVAGRDTVLEFTAANAEVGDAPAVSASTPAAAQDDDPSLLLPKWKGSVVAVWSPESRASGFVVDAASGLIVTNHNVVGSASVVEVQLTPDVKVSARVVANDATRNVAVLWIDPSVVASVQPVPLDCAGGPRPPFAEGQKVVAIGAPFHAQTDLSIGEVTRVEPHAEADFRFASGGMGGPVFSTNGALVGLTAIVDDEDTRRRRDARIVPAGDVCDVVGSAGQALQSAQRPAATLLPVEPAKTIPADALAAAVKGRVGNMNPPQVSSSDFDIAFLTPVIVYGAQHGTEQASTRTGRGSTRISDLQQARQGALTDFGDWSEYFADTPAVLVVRVTPRLVGGFWTNVARGAAYTQGIVVPPIKHFRPGFSRMRAFCGEVEVIPIHPFVLEQRVSETEAIREGLYVFDPQALGPHCGSVKLAFYSEKEPEKQDMRTIEPQVIDRVWRDFAAFRAL